MALVDDEMTPKTGRPDLQITLLPITRSLQRLPLLALRHSNRGCKWTTLPDANHAIRRRTITLCSSILINRCGNNYKVEAFHCRARRTDFVAVSVMHTPRFGTAQGGIQQAGMTWGWIRSAIGIRPRA